MRWTAAESTSVGRQAHARRGGAIAASLAVVTIVLVVLGLVMIYSASAVVAGESRGDPSYFLGRQALWAVLGLVLFIGFSRMPYGWLRPWGGAAIAGSLFAVGMTVFTPSGVEMNHAKRWLDLGGARFEPSEAVKIALVLFLAGCLDPGEKLHRPGRGRFLVSLALAGATGWLLMKQPDFGTAVLLALVAGSLYFLAGVRARTLATLGIVLGVGMTVAVVTSEYRWNRVMAFFQPAENASGSGYHGLHSRLAFGSGGLWGRGLGLGMQKLGYLPNAHNDFVFSVVGEELGFLGVASLTLLYALVVVQGTRIAMRAGDRFGMLLASGLTVLIGLQAIINMWMTLGLAPTKGMPLPFLSYGGSALAADAVAAGILLSIARARGPAWTEPIARAEAGEGMAEA